MLDPTTFETLHDALRPPEGMVFSEALATTFSLDLVALLAAPLGFVSTSVAADLRAPWTVDTQLTVLRTLQETSRRLTVFCDAAHLAVPHHGSKLMAMLEPCVVIARAPKAKAAFHPKLWLLRYTGQNGDSAVQYRLLILTRNLTFDRSLDVMARLDGRMRGSAVAARQAQPLRDFVQSLAALAVNPLDQAHQERLSRVADEVGRTDFVATGDFGELPWRFHSFGLPTSRGKSPLSLPATRRLIMSPFLSANEIKQAASASTQTILISRESALNEVPSTALKPIRAVLVPRKVLTEAATAEAESPDDFSHRVQPGDLHAKVYVNEDGSPTATWFVGSANATASGFDRNVEVLLELQGKRRVVGLDVLLPPDWLQSSQAIGKSANDESTAPLQRNPTFADLWEAFSPAPLADDTLLEQARANQRTADDLARLLTSLPWRGQVEVVEDGFSLALRLEQYAELMLADADVTVRPLTLAESRSLGDIAQSPLQWSPVAIESLTEFWPVRVVIGTGAVRGVREFLLKAPLVGAPEGREAAVTRSLLTDAPTVQRYLELLLSSEDDSIANELTSEGVGLSSAVHGQGGVSSALLEPLLRAYAARPQRVVYAGRIIEDLARADGDRSRLPSGLWELWQAFKSVLEADGLWAAVTASQERSA